ncbi:MAG TPA: PLDc N-terminal domain-containing protein, partial [Methanocorpusculum sp.]|nr:PLDc N-terminal domain-containing protein [Methanocorpusculum sp.]
MIDSLLWSLIGPAYLPFAILVLLLDIALCVTVVFLERKNPTVAIAWVLVFVVFPVLGFIIYMFFGRHLYGARIFSKKTDADVVYKNIAREQLAGWLENHEHSLNAEGFENTAGLLLNLDNSIFSDNNNIEVYTDGEVKFSSMREAILSAKHHIHIEYFIIRDDELGQEIVSLLSQKAAEGVEVRAIFDAAGTFRIRKKKF